MMILCMGVKDGLRSPPFVLIEHVTIFFTQVLDSSRRSIGSG